jgi:hypothetical protein
MAEMLSQHNALFDGGRFSDYVESSAAEFCKLQQVEMSPLDISY